MGLLCVILCKEWPASKVLLTDYWHMLVYESAGAVHANICFAALGCLIDPLTADAAL